MRPWHYIVAATAVLSAAIFGLWLFLQDKNVAVLNPQGIIAQQQKDLILFTLLLSVIIVVPVFVMLGTFAWRYRESNHSAKYTPDQEGNKWLEGLWWGIPIVIITILSVVTWVTTHQLDPYKPIASNVRPLNVQVVALQWRWLFLYPEQRVASVNELRIPAGTPVNFEITADAPMSAFWIPNLGSQTYAMNGMSARLSLQADKPGEYYGSNSNINGEGYAKMNFMAVAMQSRRDFDLWAKAIEERQGHGHLDWTEYQTLAKASDSDQTIYLHLHDTDLYTKIMNKYMRHGQTPGGGSNHESEEANH